MAFERTIEHWRALPQLSVKETAAVLGVGVDSVRTLLKQAALEARQVCGKTFVTVPSLRRLMDEEVEPFAAAGLRTLSRSELKMVRDLREGVAS